MPATSGDHVGYFPSIFSLKNCVKFHAPMKALGETVVAVQWGPWREVGMAATKGTVSWHRQIVGARNLSKILFWCIFSPKNLTKIHFENNNPWICGQKCCTNWIEVAQSTKNHPIKTWKSHISHDWHLRCNAWNLRDWDPLATRQLGWIHTLLSQWLNL